MISRIERIKFFREFGLTSALRAQSHPCLLVKRIADRRGGDLVFTYSRYQIAAPGLQESAPRSEVLRVSAHDVTEDWLNDRFAELSPNEEMAWHSWVECKGTGFHIPMIDFVERPSDSILYDIDRTLVTKMGLRGKFLFFETGRSLHAYFPDLISEPDWRKYLGRLLVLNRHECQSVIDTRWVGYALTRGFTALRWSHGTNRYGAIPFLMSVRPSIDFDPKAQQGVNPGLGIRDCCADRGENIGRAAEQTLDIEPRTVTACIQRLSARDGFRQEVIVSGEVGVLDRIDAGRYSLRIERSNSSKPKQETLATTTLHGQDAQTEEKSTHL
jgi:hypothetical protein